MKTATACMMHMSFYLWPWDSHVQFSADGHTGDLLIMPTEKLHRSGRQAAGEATLEGNKPWVLMTQHVSQDGESEMCRWLPAVEPATLYRMCPLNQRWGRYHRDPEPSRLLHLCRTHNESQICYSKTKDTGKTYGNKILPMCRQILPTSLPFPSWVTRRLQSQCPPLNSSRPSLDTTSTWALISTPGEKGPLKKRCVLQTEGDR